MRPGITALVLSSLLPLAAQPSAPDPATRAAINATALDYIEGWYEGNPERMERAVHPDLAKRIVRELPDHRFRVDQMGAMLLVQYVKKGYGKDTPKEKQQKDVQILDVYGNAASVKVTACDWVDYLQMGKVNGQWVIINVLWEMKPGR